MTIQPADLFYALLGGVLPALLWLWFWLREDRAHPEPRGLLILTFLAGMLMVYLVVPFQKETESLPLTQRFFIWATFEELFKFGAAYFTVLRRKEDNEPIDPVIYMITIALGFAALENTLFILKPLRDELIMDSIITGNLRFVGASLLHTVSSAAIGISMALSFYKGRLTKGAYLGVGILTAIALHALFNLFIIREPNSVMLATLGFVWIAIVILMLFFEKIKRIYPVNTINKTYV